MATENMSLFVERQKLTDEPTRQCYRGPANRQVQNVQRPRIFDADLPDKL